MLSFGYDTAIVVLNSHNCNYLYQVCTKLALSVVSHGWDKSSWDPTPPFQTISYWWVLGKESLSSVAFHGESVLYGSRLQGVVLNPQPHKQPWWNSEGGKTKQKDVIAGKGFVGRRVLRGVEVRQERVGGKSSQGDLYMCMKLLKNKYY